MYLKHWVSIWFSLAFNRENIVDKENYFAIIKHFVLVLPDKECIKRCGSGILSPNDFDFRGLFVFDF